MRQLRDNITDPYMHFAVEEALLRGMSQGTTPPTLRLRQTEPSVWIGVYQYPEEDVDIEDCRQNNIPVVRRHNPGGAVYQDWGSFCYTAVFPLDMMLSHVGVNSPDELYRVFGDAVIATCGRFGAKAEHSPVNDITIGGRKVYGSAQVEMYGAFAHSGTFLVDADLDRLARILRPSKLKFADKGFTDVRSRVINLSEAVGRHLDVEEVMDVLVEELGTLLNLEFYETGLTAEEMAEAKKLYEEKYGRPEWTFRKDGRYDISLSRKAKSGVVVLKVSMDGGKIASASIRGDFLAADRETVDNVQRAIEGRTLDEAQSVIRDSALPEDVRLSLLEMIKECDGNVKKDED